MKKSGRGDVFTYDFWLIGELGTLNPESFESRHDFFLFHLLDLFSFDSLPLFPPFLLLLRVGDRHVHLSSCSTDA